MHVVSSTSRRLRTLDRADCKKVAHSALAITAGYLSRELTQVEHDRTSIWHFSEAMRLLRNDLDNQKWSLESFVGIIMSLAIHAKLKGSLDECRVHLFGLQHVLEQRFGGSALLQTCEFELINKVRRTDIELALMTGLPTVWHGRSSPEPPYLVPLNGEAFEVPGLFKNTSWMVQYCLIDVQTLSSWAGLGELHGFYYQSLVIDILQRLLDFAPLSSARPQLYLDDISQLGLLAFILTILYPVKTKRLLYSDLLAKLMRDRLYGLYEPMHGWASGSCLQLRFWLTMCYTMVISEDDDAADMIVAQLEMRVLATDLGLRDWELAKECLEIYPWIGILHDDIGRQVWDSAVSG